MDAIMDDKAWLIDAEKIASDSRIDNRAVSSNLDKRACCNLRVLQSPDGLIKKVSELSFSTTFAVR